MTFFFWEIPWNTHRTYLHPYPTTTGYCCFCFLLLLSYSACCLRGSNQLLTDTDVNFPLYVLLLV